MKSILIVLFTVGLMACGSSESEPTGTYTPPSKSAAASSASAGTGDEVKLSLEGNDQMQYNKKEFKVTAGSTVTLTLKHVGTMVKEVMGHNFVLLKSGTDLASFANEAMTAVDNGYIPKETDKVIVHTKMLGGGESDTITFEAPAKGTYDFICTFPGHYGLMQGKFIVE